jgi:hypothetical protein
MKFVFCIAVICFLCRASNAQIVYTDIIDFTGTGLGKTTLRDTFNLDLNNDGVIDFQLVMWNPTFGSTPHYELKVSNLASANKLGISYDDQFIASMAFAKNSGDSIHANLVTWKNELQAVSYQIFLAYNGGSSQMGGEFLGTGDKYLPLKFAVGPNVYYGWVRVSVDNTCTQFIVKDYAYNSIANQLIFAGQITGISESTLSKIDLVVTDGQLKVLNAQGTSKENFTISLYDLNGKRIINAHDLIIDTKTFVKGVYLVELISNNARLVKKIIIE